jgi:hypothetical protein
MGVACDAYREDLAAEACGALPPEESRALGRHLAGCRGCRGDLDRLRSALAPLSVYDVEPPSRLVEYTQRRVARHMTMRLPKPGRLSRPHVLWLAMAAAVLVGFVTAFVLPALDRPAWTPRRSDMAAEFRVIWRAMDDYARAYGDWLPPAEGWCEAVSPFLDGGQVPPTAVERSRWPDNLIFLEGLSRWFRGIHPRDVLFIDRRRGTDGDYQVLLRNGSVELRTETDASRLMEVYRRRMGEGEKGFMERPQGGF